MTEQIPATMRAVQFARYGASEVLELRPISVPPLGPGAVPVRAPASGLNP